MSPTFDSAADCAVSNECMEALPAWRNMERKARIDAPGALHDIIIRGIECKAIFKDDKEISDDKIEKQSRH